MGFAAMVLGGCMADSEQLWLPILIVAVGAWLVVAGDDDERR